jgi:predicted nuclease with TOPRIM domain
LKAHVANELLQKEKGNLEKELKILEGKYNKVSVELHDVTQKLSMLETEKQVCSSCL